VTVTEAAAAPVLGCTVPRIFTPPLITGPPGPCGCGCALTPGTSYGFDVIEFARNILRRPLDPWQEWVVIHAGELLPDGRPRFRKILILVARQNGKTELLVVLTLYWLFVEKVATVLGTSTKLDYAAESWRKACRLARKIKRLRAEVPAKGGIRKANGEQVLWRADADEYELDEGSRYKIAASNEEGGRSLTIDRLVMDELRQHHDYTAHDACVPATNAIRHAQIYAISNAGSDRSVVLNDMREDALAFIETGEGDPRLGLIEYSAPDGSSPLDVDALAQANPNLGRRIDAESLLGDAMTAMKKGGEKLAGFKTENMCMHVKLNNPAVEPEKWRDCLDVGDLADARSRVALCLDIAPDGLHATLAAAAVMVDGRVRIEVIGSWDSTDGLRRDLPRLMKSVRPQVLGWLPAGPAAALAADLAERKGRAGWPPPGVKVEEIRGEVSAVCMGFAEMVKSEQVAHSDDPLLNDHVLAAEPLMQGDAWRFSRKGGGHVDAAYAAAGAVHLARTLPTPIGKPRFITASNAPEDPIMG